MSSDAEDRATTRRMSGRVRKTIERLDPSSKKSRKTRQNGNTSPDERDSDEDLSSPDEAADSDVMLEDSPSEGEPEDDEDFEAPKKSQAATRKRKATGTTANGSAKKRGRADNDDSSPAAGRKRASQPRKSRATKKDKIGDENGGTTRRTNGKDFPIDDDNELFNAVKSPNTALQTTAEDWIESYQQDPGPAMAELVNFILRCCGCNSSVDEHQAEDENGVVENLKDIVDEFKQGVDHAYPLVSKSKDYKKFRSSLGQFLLKLLTAASEDVLFSTSFYEHFQAWSHALSSSQIRALRHTATVIVLLSIDALTVLEVAIRKELSQAVRAKEAEEKKNRKDKSRLKDLEKQVQEIHERLEAVEAFEEEAYTSVFVNRYRDADYVIRAECIASLGNWMKLNPDHWIDGDYLRYIGWVLSDESKEARRDSVRALSSLYDKEQYIGKLHHFTDRFKGQLVDMAMGEHDLAVRVQAVQVVRKIEGHGLLEEEQRDEVAQLVFEKEKKVRAAAAELFKIVLDEETEQRKTELESEKQTARGRKVGGKKAKEFDAELEIQIELKVVAELLVKYGKALDGIDPEVAAEDDDDASREAQEDRMKRRSVLGLSDLVDAKVHRGRIALAAEALWDTVETMQDWQALLSYLLKDHSAPSSKGKTDSKKTIGRTKQRADNSENGESDNEAEEAQERQEGDLELPETIKLTEDEETLAIELLVACIAKYGNSTSTSTSRKVSWLALSVPPNANIVYCQQDKEQDEEEQAAVTRAVIDALPRLFAKHQTFPGRMIDILAIPRLVQLELYRDNVAAYDTLWQDIKKQFLTQTDSDVLDQAVQTISHCLGAAELSTENQGRFAELEEALLIALRDCVADKDIESADFQEDELQNLTACVARLEKLGRVKNFATLEDTDGEKQTSALEILDLIVNRGRLGYKEEARMIEHALSVLGLHLSWQLYTIALESRENGAADEIALDSISSRRSTILEKAEEFAVGKDTNACEGVKEVSLSVLLDVYFASATITSAHSDPNHHLKALRLKCSDELQARCAGYIEAEIERYADRLAQERDEDAEEQAESDTEREDNTGSSGSDTEIDVSAKQNKKKQKKNAKGKGKKAIQGKNASQKKQDKRKKKTPDEVRALNARQQARLVAAQRFERTVSGFARAIHLGIFDLRHSSLLLKYWGRLGSTFDEFARLLMHDLRDEGNYGNQGDVVASVIVESLRGAFELCVDSSDNTDEHLASLGRNLLQVVVVRGAQLAVVSSLPASDHLRIHIDSLEYIVKEIKSYVQLKRADDRNKALSFFKSLAHLVFGLDGRSALKAKSTLDSLLEKSEIEISPTSKIWEPLRAYQKRLVTNMARDPSIKSRAQAQAKKGTPRGKGKSKSNGKGEQGSDESEEEAEDVDPTPSSPTASATPSRQTPRDRKRPSPSLGREQDSQDEQSASKRIRTQEPEDEEVQDDPVDDHEAGQDDVDGSEQADESVRDGLGDLDNTLDEEEQQSPHREPSVESVTSLSDVKKRPRRR
ncbi:cohesin subunit IRR1 [Sporobolomyces koalae]|uniref:cohesin subunit IRR1 n=1 Tax=Sporobolomyces koalae TaxID=500713 RepID=UPI00317444B1